MLVIFLSSVNQAKRGSGLDKLLPPKLHFILSGTRIMEAISNSGGQGGIPRDVLSLDYSLSLVTRNMFTLPRCHTATKFPTVSLRPHREIIPSTAAFQFCSQTLRTLSHAKARVRHLHFCPILLCCPFSFFVILFSLERSTRLTRFVLHHPEMISLFFRLGLSKATDDWERRSAGACDGLIAQRDL